MILYKNEFYDLLIKNNINCISTNYYTHSEIVRKFAHCTDITTVTIDFNRTAAAHLFGIKLFLTANINMEEFRIGIIKNNKPAWSPYLSCNIRYNEFEKFLKLKSFW